MRITVCGPGLHIVAMIFDVAGQPRSHCHAGKTGFSHCYSLITSYESSLTFLQICHKEWPHLTFYFHSKQQVSDSSFNNVFSEEPLFAVHWWLIYHPWVILPNHTVAKSVTQFDLTSGPDRKLSFCFWTKYIRQHQQEISINRCNVICWSVNVAKKKKDKWPRFKWRHCTLRLNHRNRTRVECCVCSHLHTSALRQMYACFHSRSMASCSFTSIEGVFRQTQTGGDLSILMWTISMIKTEHRKVCSTNSK